MLAVFSTMPSVQGLVIEEKDIPFEEDLLRNPYVVKGWLRYLDFKRGCSSEIRNKIFERSLKVLPGSYKLWHRYLTERVKAVKYLSPVDSSRKTVNHVFERALVFLHKMPRIWEMYLEHLVPQLMITFTRRTFDEALRSLAITQHCRIWPLYLDFLKMHSIPETSVRVHRRHLMLEADGAEEYITYLIGVDRVDDAAVKLAEIVNNDAYVSKKGKSNHQLWVQLCNLISKNPNKIQSLKVEAIIRGGLGRFTDMVGTLWISLADYYIRQGNFDKARDIYEEAIRTVMTVRDFSQVFDAYSQFEETALSAMMETDDSDVDDADLQLRMARFEYLMDRRPLLLSSVMLRQNPHNVEEWHKRVDLFKTPREKVACFAEAVQTVDPQMAVGSLPSLWIAFSKVYEDNKELKEARAIFDKAVTIPFKNVEDLAGIWCEYAEMEIRAKHYKQALRLLEIATTPDYKIGKNTGFHDSSLTVQARVHKSLKIWALYADLQESIGTTEATKAVYNGILELRIANPQIVLNYAAFLEDKNYFEESFTAFERGIGLFKYPIVYELWNAYLLKFISRYGGRKIERARELFEQALVGCTPKYLKHIFLLYATYEEEHGLARHAMAVYERAASAVPGEEQLELWLLYIKRAQASFGVTFTRDLYQKALESLPDKAAKEIAVQFADMERKLGEIDRARAIYSYASQFSDPRTAKVFWKTWNDFEVRHGNEDTYKEMLRLKRSVAALYNTTVNFAASMAAAEEVQHKKDSHMATLEAQAAAEAKRSVMSFVKAGGGAMEVSSSANKAEINLDDDDSDDEEGPSKDSESGTAQDADDDAKEIIVPKSIPDGVFGGVEAGSSLGAKARFQAKGK